MGNGILVCMACLLALTGLSGCGSESSESRTPSQTGSDRKHAAAPRLTVAVTIPPQAEFVERVGGEYVRAMVMIPPGAEPHTYEPTPQQLVRLSSVQAYAELGSGITFERIWMRRIRDVNPDLVVINCGAGIQRQGNDPHIWLSLRNARVMADTIRANLSRLDSRHAAAYQRNFDAYAAELTALDQQLAERIRATGLRSFLVYHPSWGYFARDYGLQQVSVEHEGKEPTAQRLGRLIQRARTAHIGAVFVSPEFQTRSARAVAAEIGVPVLVADPLPRHYLDQMRRFADLLAQTRR